MLLGQPFLQPCHQGVCHLHILKICARHHSYSLNQSAQSQICALRSGVHTIWRLAKIKPVYSYYHESGKEVQFSAVKNGCIPVPR